MIFKAFSYLVVFALNVCTSTESVRPFPHALEGQLTSALAGREEKQRSHNPYYR